VDSTASSLNALCFDRLTGKVLWNKTVAKGAILEDDKSNYATPSPVADAAHCFFFYGNGIMAAFDHAGNQLWSRNILKDFQPLAFNWTFSCAPALYGDRLFMQVLQRDVPTRGHGRTTGPNDSALLVLDPATGAQLARVPRPTDAVAESRESYTTPIPLEFQGRTTIMVCGGNYVTGHDPLTGKEVWRSPNFNPLKKDDWRMVASPVVSDGVILICSPQVANPIVGIKLAGGGPQPATTIAWSDNDHTEASADVPTPVVLDGDFFVLGDRKSNLSRVEPATGKIKWTVPTPGSRKYETPPTAGDGKIYLMNQSGQVAVVNAADGAILHTIPMGDPGEQLVRSPIAISGGALFIRTNHKLYCVGAK
jgi:outer membrane protein assembly factor BamB